jgi:2,4-dienoyl-CoA reductase-like NADH-dependent reductase (Old Yellow Enzyme family)
LFADPGLTGIAPAAPSPIEGVVKTAPEPLSAAGVGEIVQAFGRAAGRAKAAGFDGVQLHAAHGYLLSQFLSPFFNRRSDRYGGTVENRVRIVVESLEEIRRRVGKGFPVLIKMNTNDYLDGGLSTGDAVRAAAILENRSIDAIELSGGTGLSGTQNPVRTGIRKTEDEAYFSEAAMAFRTAVSVPILLVGGIRSLEVAQRLLQDRGADYISMSRPFIREPDLIRRWQSGDSHKAACLSDSRCFAPARSGKGIYCVMKERQRRPT